MSSKTSAITSPPRHSQRHFQESSKGDNKKLRTRALLLDTAIAVFSQKGIEATSILEITEAAGLSNGSFYYHFADKPALVDAVAEAMAEALVRAADAGMSEIEQGSERVANGVMFFVSHATSNPAWGRLIAHALGEQGPLRELALTSLSHDVELGISQGELDATTSSALYTVLLGIAIAAMVERLRDSKATGIEVTAVEAILRVLGMRPARARTLAHKAQKRVEAFAKA